jgi:hypothetical protein
LTRCKSAEQTLTNASYSALELLQTCLSWWRWFNRLLQTLQSKRSAACRLYGTQSCPDSGGNRWRCSQG